MIDLGDKGESLVLGLADDSVAVPAATISTVYDMAILSAYGPSVLLENDELYPYYTRIVLSTSQEVRVLYDQLVEFYENYGTGWSDIAVISSIDQNSIEYSNYFIKLAEEGGILNVKTFQQVLTDQEDVSLELDGILKSGARVIVSAVFNNTMNVLEQAYDKGLVGVHYVWTINSIVQTAMYPSFILQGIITVQPEYPIGNPNEKCYRDAYRAADPNTYFGAGGELPYGFVFNNPLDVIMSAMIAADTIDKMELLDKRVPAALWTEAIRNVSYQSVDGHVSWDEKGDRIINTELVFAEPANLAAGGALMTPYLRLTTEGEILKLRDIIWFSNTTDIPDLDVRPPFHYWSCKDGKKGYDETGKTVTIHSPDGSDVDEIDIDYHCDAFIDCKNLSDETNDCSTNYLVIFIVFGIITVFLMCIALFLILFVIIFGIILKYQRVKFLSPYFLIILLISIFIGFSSVFAFYGQPHPVSCAFQPWLLGLPTISMIVILTAKNYRVFRIFSSPLKRVRVTDLRLFMYWCLAMFPALVIVVLWMIISTPTADFVERGDDDHYVCVTGGFTGYPGGYVFFAVFVAYTSLLLLVGCIISILARNIHPLFNESKLLTISIYNLGFLAAVIIPVFLVVQPFNPFIAWILRTCAVLYAFSTTMFLQFAPIIFGVCVLDRFKNKQHQLMKNEIQGTSSVSQTSKPSSGASSGSDAKSA